MKKIITIILAMIIAFGCIGLTACNNGQNDDKLSIVCTIFPQYDWVRQIVGKTNVELTLLLDNGVDLHSYQPSVDDIAKISLCDIFIYVGGESDDWVEDALKNAINKDMVVINLLEVLGDKAKEEEIKEGMEHEHEHEHEEDEEHEHEEEVEYDEHVWLSLKNAQIFCTKIADELAKLDEKNASKYEKNLNTYLVQLRELDAKYAQAVENATHTTLVFGDRFPFRYLVDDYNLDYFAAFTGCSAETEASFETFVFLAQKIDELSLPAVCTIEGTNHSLAETVKNNTTAKNQLLLTFDSMQSTTITDIENGTTYLSIMLSNLSVLKQALGV